MVLRRARMDLTDGSFFPLDIFLLLAIVGASSFKMCPDGLPG